MAVRVHQHRSIIAFPVDAPWNSLPPLDNVPQTLPMPASPMASRMTRFLRGCAMAGLVLLVTLPGLAQEAAFRHFGLEDGLPQSQVSALMEDRHGFLWVGTNTNGLARLAAGRFSPYGIAQGVQARSISDLMEDRDGNIWAASFDNGLSEISGSDTRNYGPDQGLGSSQVYTLALDPDGSVLAGTRLGLYRQNPDASFARVPLPGAWANLPVFVMRQDGPGHVWLASRGGHIARWDGHAMEEHPLPQPFQGGIQDLKVASDGVPFVLLRDKVLRLSGDAWVPVPVPGVGPDPKFRFLGLNGGSIQISLGGDGLWIQDPDGRVRILRHEDGLPREGVSCVVRDSNGVLWIGTDGGGLLAQALPQLQAITQGGLPGEGLGAVMGFLALGKGDFLLASSTGIYRYQEGKGIIRRWTKDTGMVSGECWSPLSDGHGGAWVGTDRGLVHWHPDGRLERGPKEMDLVTVVALVRQNGHLFAGTDQGLYEVDEQGRYVGHWPTPPEQGLNQVFNLMVDGPDLLVGLRLGVYAFSDGKWEKRFLDAPFVSQSINAMTRDSNGHLWVGTVNGLFERESNGWVSRGLHEGLPDDNISFIQALPAGRVAVGHGKGVSILGMDGPEGRLTRSQGLLSDETNHAASLLDDQGRLWIGMIGGANVLNGAAAFTSSGLPPPVVREVRWPGGTRLYPDQIELAPHPSAVIFAYDVASPLVSDQPQIESFMEGLDATWKPADGVSLHYLNLAGGSYRLRLRASSDGVHWQESHPVVLIIRLAWYERGWVRALAILGLLMVAGGLVWWRLRRLRHRADQLEGMVRDRTDDLARQNRALELAHGQIKRELENRLRLMDMVTHDLRSPLTSLTLSVDRLREGPEDGTEREMLHGILHKETQRMEIMVRQLLDRSRAESFFHAVDLKPCSPKELVRSIEDVLRVKAADKQLRFDIEEGQGTGETRVMADASAMQQVLLNLFENALKFTPEGGQIGIRSTVEPIPRVWRLEVWDTGRGLSKEEAERILHPFAQAKAEDAARGWGLGLSICLSLLELQKGELRVRSEPGQGAAFIISLPLIEG